jgi:hypothetical protein
MKVTILFILLASLASCGNSNRSPSTVSQLGSALQPGGEFSSSEKNIALKICYAFRSKNTNYRASFLDSTFSFDLTYTGCRANVDEVEKRETLNTILKAPLTSMPMIFDASTDIPFNNLVETDKHGALKYICSELLAGRNPTKSKLSGSKMVEVSFYTSGLDNIIVRTASSVSGAFVIDQEELFEVDTSVGNKTGQVKLIERERACDSGKVESLSQQLFP